MLDDTITAISTAMGEAGIGIVRISGKQAIEIWNKIFILKENKTINKIEARKIYYGFIRDRNGMIIDEVITFIMQAPNSYTTEDVVEIQCHGGLISVRKIMDTVLSLGARMAEPGEFTKRAFLNGRIDLSQAEAVIDVIKAKTDTSLNVAVQQLEGELSIEIRKNTGLLLDALAHIEASIDFPEHDIEDITQSNIYEIICKVKEQIKKLLDSFYEGKIVRDGLATAIVGKPNVGKSSLLNVLLKQNRAIVTDVPGTTRDIIEEYINIGSILLKLIDTAGIRETVDIVEKLGVERTIEAIYEADLVLFVCDISEQLTQQDEEILERIKNKKTLIIANKIDKGVNQDLEKLKERFGEESIIPMSVLNKTGLDQLETMIKKLIFNGKVETNHKKLITNIRHKNQLAKAYDAINRVLDAIEDGIPIDLLTVDIRETWSNLGEIIGETVNEDIINEIFTKFCIGK